MNVGEVEGLGNKLKGVASDINNMVKLLNGKVQNTSWVGPDATKFKNDWWPQHRQHLLKMVKDLDGFGQSALNNAQAQKDASGR
jgi:hypothetical protein